MVLLQTPKVDIGWQAADFLLEATDGKKYSLNDVCGKNGLVVMFISNHCPYVKAIQNKLTKDMLELQQYGINAVAICSNDEDEYPEDNMHNMRIVAQEYSYPFPYLHDANQTVAREYDAICTPDFFGFDKDLKLQYRGRLDDSGMEIKENRKRDLFDAMFMVAETGNAPAIQQHSIGCSIKWKQ